MSTSSRIDVRSKSRRQRLFELVREDWQVYQPQPLLRPGFHALVVHRVGHAVGAEGRAPLSIRFLRKGLLGLTFLTRAVYGIELPWETSVGRRVFIGHQGGIVIAPDAVIGEDCLIKQNVTIGAVRDGGPAPRIGRGVRIGAGAVIVGDIEIGDGALIGPNCVVSTNVPPGARVVAAPSRILGGSAEPTSSGAPEKSAAADRFDAEGVAAVVREALHIDVPVHVDTPLLTSGLIDSLNLVVAIEALEARYGVSVRSEDIDGEDFDTPAQIAEYLRGQSA